MPDQEAIDALAEALEWDDIQPFADKDGWKRNAERIASRLRSRGFDIVRKE